MRILGLRKPRPGNRNAIAKPHADADTPMNANAASLLNIFEKKHRLEVPLFQRQYVWGLTQQWQPLWEDIARKFTETLEGRTDAPVHFLGAIVLDQKQTPTTHVENVKLLMANND
jgi:hypothetical protein